MLSNTTSYYVDATDNGCTTGIRTKIDATIYTIPTIITTSPVSNCGSGTLTLGATASAGVINWYTTLTGGTSIASGTSFTTPLLSNTTSYYVDAIENGCTTGIRTKIDATIKTIPNIIYTSPASNCGSGTLTLGATASAGIINWYTSLTGGSSIATGSSFTTPLLSNTTSYFVDTIENGCTTGIRTKIDATIYTIPTIITTSPVSNCGSGTLTLGATASAGVINWYTTLTGGTSIGTGTSFTTPFLSNTTSYYVDATDNGCTTGIRTKIDALINPLPIVNNITITQCDTDAFPDGKTLFNLKVNNNVISLNYTNETFTFYKTQNGAINSLAADLIANDLAFENISATGMFVWARVVNTTTGCFSVAKLTLIIPATNIPATYKVPIPPVCDDFLDTNGNNNSNNNNRDGIASFDLTASKATIKAILPSTDAYNINYYRNKTDALDELNPITNLSNYRNIGYPDSQDIWVRVDSNLDNACYGIGPYITLSVEALPLVNLVILPRKCDDNQDGIVSFDTSSLENSLLNGQTKVKVTYFDSNNNPLKDSNGVSISSPFPVTFSSTSQTIKAILTNDSALKCSDETFITFIVDALPIANPIPNALTTVCDDEQNPADQDGKFAFDTATFEAMILGTQIGMNIRYFEQNGNPLNPLPNPFVTKTQDVRVVVENPLNSSCTATTTIQFVVNPIPNIDLNLDGSQNKLVCTNLPNFFVTLDAGILDNSPTTSYSYAWKKGILDLISNFPNLGVNTAGIYSVEVTNKISGCSSKKTIGVVASDVAIIDSIDVVDLEDVNTINVNASGSGDYQYAIDAQNTWQDSNYFANVAAGIHTVFVEDKNGCGLVSKEVVVVGIPKYFTPNADGYNDIWGIVGLKKYPSSVVDIFDRYGKLISTLNYINPSWDGTLNGSPLPADDYWYAITLEKDKPTLRGHFTLKR